MWCSHI
jgi:hypothetical protein